MTNTTPYQSHLMGVVRGDYGNIKHIKSLQGEGKLEIEPFSKSSDQCGIRRAKTFRGAKLVRHMFSRAL